MEGRDALPQASSLSFETVQPSAKLADDANGQSGQSEVLCRYAFIIVTIFMLLHVQHDHHFDCPNRLPSIVQPSRLKEHPIVVPSLLA